MTSIERHEARYQRRKAKREQKRLEFIRQFLNVENVFSTQALITSAKKCRKGVHWKSSVQSYFANLVRNSRRTSKAVLDGTWKTLGFHIFHIIERGKPREIKSVAFSERCLQRSLCDNFLVPILSHYLAYDNSATLPKKGTHFALKRLKKHLRWFIRRYGLQGYIFLFDFSKYFAHIDIEKLKILVDKYLPDSLMKDMYHTFINVFKGAGLGLGSQVSQISAVFFANVLDHIIKDKLGIKCFARYMDDGYIILNDLEEMKAVVNVIHEVCESLGIKLNKKKTRIYKLTDNFRFLKKKMFITDTGKIIFRVSRDVMKKERTRLRKFKHLLDADKMTYCEIVNAFQSWARSLINGHNFNILYNMIRYFNKIYQTQYKVTTKKKGGYKTLRYLANIA